MYMEFFLLHKNCKPWNKIEAAILHSNDIGTFNCVLCNLIAHLTFQMRKVLVIRNSNKTTRHFSAGGGVWTAGHETRPTTSYMNRRMGGDLSCSQALV